jgi:ferritin-like metal-binding protein YciE
MTDVQDLLKETLAEEESTDELLSELAEDAINPQAAA